MKDTQAGQKESLKKKVYTGQAMLLYNFEIFSGELSKNKFM